MTKLFDQKKSSPLGKGEYFATGALLDNELQGQLMRYRRSVASAYTSTSPDDIGTAICSSGPFHVSPKVDGELWFLILEDGNAFLVSPRGAVISGAIPVLDEAQPASKTVKGRTVIAGELYAAAKSGEDRPRVTDVSAALGGGAKASVDQLGFMAFDLVQVPEESYEFIIA